MGKKSEKWVNNEKKKRELFCVKKVKIKYFKNNNG